MTKKQREKALDIINADVQAVKHRRHVKRNAGYNAELLILDFENRLRALEGVAERKRLADIDRDLRGGR